MFDGQSLNHSSAPNTYPYLTMEDLNYPWIVPAKSGHSWTELTDDVESRLFKPVKSYLDSVLILFGGTSDLIATEDNDTGEQALADMEAYADNAVAAGYKTVLAGTVPPSALLDVDGENQRIIMNDGIRASIHWEDTIEIANDPQLSDNLDVTYYYDQTHWTEAGNQIAANLVKEKLQYYL